MKKRVILALICLCCAAVVGCAQSQISTDTTVDTDNVTEEGAGGAYTPDQNVIFLDAKDGNDENDALTPDSAVKSYEAAYEFLANDRNRIVVINSPKAQSVYSLPKYDGLVVFTSVHDGVDYMEKNEATLNLSDVFSVNSDVLFENIKLRPRVLTSYICFNYHNATIGENVITHNNKYNFLNIVCGYNVTDLALNAPVHMTAKQVSYTGDCTLTVKSGEWDCIIGGNYRQGYDSPMGTFNGNMTINIEGTAKFSTDSRIDDVEGLGIAATGQNITKGNVILNIKNGVIECPIFGVGKVGRYYNFTNANGKNGTDGTQFGRDVRYEANVTVNISGGDFSSTAAQGIVALQAPGDTALHGNFTLNVTGGDFNDNFTASGFGVIGDTEVNGFKTEKSICFDKINGSATNEAEPIRIACCGDSITFGTCAEDAVIDKYTYKKENQFYPNQMQKLYGTSAVVGNFGYPGSYVGTSHNKYLNSCVYAALCEFDPDVIVIALGTNNASLMPSGVSSFLTYYRTMLKDMHERFPDAKIVMTTALYRWDNADRTAMVDQYIIPSQKQLAEEFDYVYLYDAYTEYKPYGTTTYYKDKLHPNNLGYQKLAEVMKKGVDELLKKAQ